MGRPGGWPSGRLTAGCAGAARLRAVAFELIREIPDTALAARFDGEPMVQSFRASREPRGRVWITTAEALTVPGFGRPWVAGAS